MSKTDKNQLKNIINSKLIATVNVGVNPTAMAITSDSTKLYVANGNNYGIAGSDTVTLIDLTTMMPVLTISSGTFNQPYTITLSKDETKAYVTNSNASTVSIIDTATNKVTGIIDGFNGPSGMVITPDGTKSYVNNYGASKAIPSGSGNTVSVVDLISEKIIQEITLSEYTQAAAPSAIAISPKGDFVYTANYTNGEPWQGTLSKISTATNVVVDTIGGAPFLGGTPFLFGMFALKIDASGKFAYLTNFGSNNFAPYGTTVCVIDLEQNTQSALIEVGIQPSGFDITPDGLYGFVSNYNTLYSSGAPDYTGLTAGQGTVNIIDLSTNLLVPITINVGLSPGCIKMSPDGKYAIVSNYTGNTVSIISLYGE
ncbi:YncE family protein [Flavobacterium sp. AG291]|uniref:YncE family protein n=1 Tax=Flavobacterium sp. AG291 TaxID=2184000 RepID=UPI000E0AA31E|nr:YncE family protein [Flavobacterium sp. AG291]RDI10478.1 YVTN family beta-propeller protein [Flavobacterium sp. AG291]